MLTEPHAPYRVVGTRLDKLGRRRREQQRPQAGMLRELLAASDIDDRLAFRLPHFQIKAFDLTSEGFLFLREMCGEHSLGDVLVAEQLGFRKVG